MGQTLWHQPQQQTEVLGKVPTLPCILTAAFCIANEEQHCRQRVSVGLSACSDGARHAASKPPTLQQLLRHAIICQERNICHTTLEAYILEQHLSH